MALTRSCRVCGGTFDAARLVKSHRAAGGVEALCLGCRERRRRGYTNPLGVDGTNRAVEHAPDLEPAIRSGPNSRASGVRAVRGRRPGRSL